MVQSYIKIICGLKSFKRAAPKKKPLNSFNPVDFFCFETEKYAATNWQNLWPTTANHDPSMMTALNHRSQSLLAFQHESDSLGRAGADDLVELVHLQVCHVSLHVHHCVFEVKEGCSYKLRWSR